MKKLSIIFLLLTACATPSTMLVNRQGKVMRCSSTGAGYGIAGAIAIGTAQQSHNRCVDDLKLVGFTPIPKVAVGFRTDTKKTPMPITELGASTKAAGLAVGDLILEMDNRKISHAVDILAVLNTKNEGDTIQVKVQRDEQTLTYPVPVLLKK